MAKLRKKVKVRTQREALLINIPKAMAEMMEIKKGSSVMITHDKDKLIVEMLKDDE